MDEFLTIDEIAKKLKLHPATITKYIREGKLMALKFGRVWRVTEEDLKEFIKKSKMKYLKYLVVIAVSFSLLYLMFPQTAYAYLDPGTGSYILQLAIAILLGGSLVIKIYWRKIKVYFLNLFSKKNKDDV